MVVFKIEIVVVHENYEQLSAIIHRYDIQGIVEKDSATEKSMEIFVSSADKDHLIDDLNNSGLIKENAKVESADDSKDWVQDWKDDYEDIPISGFTIRPPWAEEFDEGDIIINPSMGFGTGKHETTQLAAKLLRDAINQKTPENFLDVGTGSGILSFFVEKLGVTSILGIDICEDSINNAQENHKLNQSNFAVFKKQELHEISEKYELVCANIIAEVLLNIQGELKRVLSPGGTLVICGIHENFADEVKTSFKKDFKILKFEQLGEWYGAELKAI